MFTSNLKSEYYRFEPGGDWLRALFMLFLYFTILLMSFSKSYMNLSFSLISCLNPSHSSQTCFKVEAWSVNLFFVYNPSCSYYLVIASLFALTNLYSMAPLAFSFPKRLIFFSRAASNDSYTRVGGFFPSAYRSKQIQSRSLDRIRAAWFSSWSNLLGFLLQGVRFQYTMHSK